MMKSFKQRGFSLIELLVVIGIISILASVVIASLSSAHDTALAAKMKNNVQQWKLAIVQYVQDHGQYPICDQVDTTHQSCCIGGTSCTVGVLSANGSLTAITALNNQNIKKFDQTAIAYYRQQLASNERGIYTCDHVTADADALGLKYCDGNATITYAASPTAINVDPVRTSTVSGGGESSSSADNPGCMDSSANDYDSTATTDNGSCTYDESSP